MEVKEDLHFKVESLLMVEHQGATCVAVFQISIVRSLKSQLLSLISWKVLRKKQMQAGVNIFCLRPGGFHGAIFQ